MQQPSVLIIDDSEIERYILSHQLKKIGVSEIMQQTNGTSGLEFLKNHLQNLQQYGASFPPAIIILDVNMPIMDGFEFLQKFAELKTQVDLDICQILMYSGSDDPQEKARALQYDFVKGFLIKGESSTEELKIEIGIT
ncbi:MAG: CheY-like chemotaxis protein [Gammaproteobacteria bacterium]|jgi:CheY-like chemotaxis protein